MYRMCAHLICSTLLLSGGASAWAAPETEQLRRDANQIFAPIPTQHPRVESGDITPAQIELGRKLFFDPRLSRSQIISCNSCHNVGTGGADNVPVSIGHGWQKGPRNSPTVLNAVFNVAQFWDGRADDLAAQAKGPVQASVEMNNTPERVEQTLNSMPAYVDAFREAYPDSEPAVSFDRMASAIEAFETTLITPNSRFDRFLAGEDTLDATEQQGLSLFMSSGCAACHNGVNVGGQAYYPFGVVERPGADILPEEDKGRFAVTATATDEYVFRAGPLRNIARTAPYFHSGQVWDLEQAVAIMSSSQLGVELEDAQVSAITAFLHTLTGEQPEVTLPALPTSTPDTPRPE